MAERKAVVYKEHRQRRASGRCARCGGSTLVGVPCRRHPDSAVIPWPQAMRVAWHLICKWGWEGRNLDHIVEHCDESDLTGTSRGDLALALSLARTWNTHDFEEAFEAPAPSAKPLYG